MALQIDPAQRDGPRIVKAKLAVGLGTPIAFNYHDLVEQCDEHLAEVRQHSQQLLDTTAAEADRLRKEATEAGRKAGYQAGLKAAEADVASRVDRLANERMAQQLETVLPAIRQLAEQMLHEQDRWVSRWEHEAVRLAVAISEKLLHRTLAADPTAADAIIVDTLRIAAGTPTVRVRLAPVDIERLGESTLLLNDALSRLGDTSIEGDERVTPGGCLIETKHGRIDGRLDVMLNRIAAELCDDVTSSSVDSDRQDDQAR